MATTCPLARLCVRWRAGRDPRGALPAAPRATPRSEEVYGAALLRGGEWPRAALWPGRASGACRPHAIIKWGRTSVYWADPRFARQHSKFYLLKILSVQRRFWGGTRPPMCRRCDGDAQRPARGTFSAPSTRNNKMGRTFVYWADPRFARNIYGARTLVWVFGRARPLPHAG